MAKTDLWTTTEMEVFYEKRDYDSIFCACTSDKMDNIYGYNEEDEHKFCVDTIYPPCPYGYVDKDGRVWKGDVSPNNTPESIKTNYNYFGYIQGSTIYMKDNRPLARVSTKSQIEYKEDGDIFAINYEVSLVNVPEYGKKSWYVRLCFEEMGKCYLCKDKELLIAATAALYLECVVFEEVAYRQKKKEEEEQKAKAATATTKKDNRYSNVKSKYNNDDLLKEKIINNSPISNDNELLPTINDNTGIIIKVIAVIGLLAVIGVIIYLFFIKDDSKNNNTSTNNSTFIEATTPTAISSITTIADNTVTKTESYTNIITNTPIVTEEPIQYITETITPIITDEPIITKEPTKEPTQEPTKEPTPIITEEPINMIDYYFNLDVNNKELSEQDGYIFEFEKKGEVLGAIITKHSVNDLIVHINPGSATNLSAYVYDIYGNLLGYEEDTTNNIDIVLPSAEMGTQYIVRMVNTHYYIFDKSSIDIREQFATNKSDSEIAADYFNMYLNADARLSDGSFYIFEFKDDFEVKRALIEKTSNADVTLKIGPGHNTLGIFIYDNAGNVLYYNKNLTEKVTVTLPPISIGAQYEVRVIGVKQDFYQKSSIEVKSN